MLTIATSDPQNHQDNVYRDIKINITFSHEVHDTSLKADFFKLYIMSPTPWGGYVPVSISKTSNIVHLIPDSDLSENTEYCIWIKGDKDLTDETYDGVASLTGEVLDGHQLIYFTTGTLREIDVEVREDIGGYDPVPGGPVTATSEELQEIYDSNTYLDVVKTVPMNYQRNVDDVSTIKVTFDQKIIINESEGVSGVAIRAENYTFGVESDVPEVTALEAQESDERNLLISTDNNISRNTIYTVTLFRDYIDGYKVEKLVEDYEFSFITELFPMYTSESLVRHRGGYLIPNSIEGYVIDRYIFEASKWVIDEILEYTEYPSGTVPLPITNLVTCKSIHDIAIGITDGTLKGIKEKQLADLRIVYDSAGLDSALNRIQECIDNNMAVIGTSKVKHGIKSRFGSARKYPGFKRHIHKFNKEDLTWPPNL